MKKQEPILNEKQEPIPNEKQELIIAENEASVKRWLMTAVVGFLIGSALSVPIYAIIYIIFMITPGLREGGGWSEFSTFIQQLTLFAAMYWGMVIAIKKIGKTSHSSFILGADRKENTNVKKEFFIFAGLYLLGIVIVSIFSGISTISLRTTSPAKIIFVIVFSLLFTWMQTGWEELLFRGIPLRILCKNNIKFSGKAFLITLIPSVLFMLAHITNPEVQQYTGIQKVFMIATYFIPAIGLTLCDMLWGSLLPGIAIHWINNFFVAVILSETVSVSGATSIWIDSSQSSGVASFFSTIIAYIPVFIYLIIVKKKAAKPAENKNM